MGFCPDHPWRRRTNTKVYRSVDIGTTRPVVHNPEPMSWAGFVELFSHHWGNFASVLGLAVSMATLAVATKASSRGSSEGSCSTTKPDGDSAGHRPEERAGRSLLVSAEMGYRLVASSRSDVGDQSHAHALVRGSQWRLTRQFVEMPTPLEVDLGGGTHVFEQAPNRTACCPDVSGSGPRGSALKR